MATQEELLRQRARRGQAPGAASGPVPDSRDADQDLVGNAAIQDQMLADRDQGLLDQAGFQGRSMDLPFADEVSAAFGIDPAAVQAYQGNRGAMDALNANAFATGDTVAFRDASPSRDQVFEEVAHVVQQSRGQGRGVSDQGASSERYAGAGQAVGSGADASLHRDAAGADEEEISLPAKADSIAEITIKPGGTYTVSEADLDNGEGEAWKKIARAHGMHEDLLIPFNQHVASVEVDGAMANMAVAPQLVQGVQLYIPSAEELAFAECRRKAGSYEEAVTLYGELASGSSIKLITAARDRASGRVGESYGTKGVDGPKDGAGVFLTPNKDLAGASRRRSEKIDGQREYRVNWNASHDGFWKCSVFLHDNLFQAGYTPDLTSTSPSTSPRSPTARPVRGPCGSASAGGAPTSPTTPSCRPSSTSPPSTTPPRPGTSPSSAPRPTGPRSPSAPTR